MEKQHHTDVLTAGSVVESEQFSFKISYAKCSFTLKCSQIQIKAIIVLSGLSWASKLFKECWFRLRATSRKRTHNGLNHSLGIAPKFSLTRPLVFTQLNTFEFKTTV